MLFARKLETFEPAFGKGAHEKADDTPGHAPAKLKRRTQAEGITSGGGDGGTGKKSGEIKNIQAIVQVFEVCLQAQGTSFFFVQLCACGYAHGHIGLDSSVAEVYAVDHLLSVLGQGLVVGSGEFEGQTTALFRFPRQP